MDPSLTGRRRAWKIAAVASLGLFAVLPLMTAGRYGDAQGAASAAAFRSVVDGRVEVLRMATLVDFAFAATYAVAGLLAAASLDRRSSRLVRSVAVAASSCMVLGALLDEIENVRLWRNLGDVAAVSDEAVRRMSGPAPVKLVLAFGGAVVLMLCLVADWVARRRTTEGEGPSMFDLLVAWEKAADEQSTRARFLSMVGVGVVGAASGTTAVAVRPGLLASIALAVVALVCLWGVRFLAPRTVGQWPPALRGVALWVARHRRPLTVAAAIVTALAVALLLPLGPDRLGQGVYVIGIVAYLVIGSLLTRLRHLEAGRLRRGVALLVVLLAIGALSLVLATTRVELRWLWGLGIAVVLIPIAIALVAESAAASPRLPESLAVGWGFAAVAAGVAALGLAGIGSVQSVVGALVLAAIVAAIATNSSHDIVLVVLVIGLVWALDPGRAGPEPDPVAGTAARPQPAVIALGDSYMSGEGASEYFDGTNHSDGSAPNQCRRSPTAYPALLEEELVAAGRPESRDHQVLFLACSGATARQLTDDAQHAGEPVTPWSTRGVAGPGEPKGQAQVDQALDAIEHLHLDPRVIIISIGGNDAGFGEIGRICGLAGDCSQVGAHWLDRLGIDEATAAEGTVRSSLAAAYADIRSRLVDRVDSGDPSGTRPPPRVLVVPYPVPLNDSGCRSSLLTSDEHRFLVGFTRALDAVIADEAADAGFDFLAAQIDLFSRADVRVCDTSPGQAAVNQLAASPVAGVFLQQVSPRDWFHNTFHPNARGHALIADEVAHWINEGDPRRTASGAAIDDVRSPSSLEEIMGYRFDHCGAVAGAPTTCHQGLGPWSAAALTRLLWLLVLPAGLVSGGALLLTVAVMRRWRAARARAWAPDVNAALVAAAPALLRNLVP